MSDTIRHAGKWLRFHERVFRNAENELRSWEYVTRSSTEGAVCAHAVVPGEEERLVLVRQFRPPLDAKTIEFPAGLIDAGETPGEAALRELEEETGFIGTVRSIGPAVYSSPGLTDEFVMDVVIDVTGEVAQRNEPDEAIEVLTLPIAGLFQALEKLAADGARIDARLWYFAAGLAQGRVQ
jgi:8-oxo-dGTP pyrophosphatase MutT (NUDIX family)